MISGKKSFLVCVLGMILLVFRSSIFGFQLIVSQVEDVLIAVNNFLVVRDAQGSQFAVQQQPSSKGSFVKIDPCRRCQSNLAQADLL